MIDRYHMLFYPAILRIAHVQGTPSEKGIENEVSEYLNVITKDMDEKKKWEITALFLACAEEVIGWIYDFSDKKALEGQVYGSLFSFLFANTSFLSEI